MDGGECLGWDLLKVGNDDAMIVFDLQSILTVHEAALSGPCVFRCPTSQQLSSPFNWFCMALGGTQIIPDNRAVIFCTDLLFLQAMLQPDWRLRPTAESCLNHPFLKGKGLEGR